jgi:hypothetical protein
MEGFFDERSLQRYPLDLPTPSTDTNRSIPFVLCPSDTYKRSIGGLGGWPSDGIGTRSARP